MTWHNFGPQYLPRSGNRHDWIGFTRESLNPKTKIVPQNYPRHHLMKNLMKRRLTEVLKYQKNWSLGKKLGQKELRVVSTNFTTLEYSKVRITLENIMIRNITFYIYIQNYLWKKILELKTLVVR